MIGMTLSNNIQQNAFAAGRASAEEDTKMLDWLETNQYAIGFPSDGEFGKTGWSLFFDEGSRDITDVPTLRQAIRTAMSANLKP